jgi:hypothetical protein
MRAPGSQLHWYSPLFEYSEDSKAFRIRFSSILRSDFGTGTVAAIRRAQSDGGQGQTLRLRISLSRASRKAPC